MTKYPKGLQPTLICKMRNVLNKNVITNPVRVILDRGSNLVLAKKAITKKLQCNTIANVALNLSVVAGEKINSIENVVEFELQNLRGDFVFPHKIAAITTKKVATLPPVLCNPSDYDHLRDVKFTEMYPQYNSRMIDLLIGEPYATHMLKGSIRRGLLNEPAAQDTVLGWALCGANPDDVYEAHLCVSDEVKANIMLANVPFDFKQMWDLSNVGITPIENTGLTEEETAAVEQMVQISRYDPNERRWYTGLLWKDESENGRYLDDNLLTAIAIMRSIKSSAKEEHKDYIRKAFDAFLKNGTSEEVPRDQRCPHHPTYVLVARPVMQLWRVTTPCRICINAAQKSKSNNKSLNNLLRVGPNLLPQIPEIILGFRLKPYVFALDIRKMFLQVYLDKDSDKDMLRYVWSDFDQSEPTMYRHKVLPFGLLSSPFQAIWCLQETARMFKAEFPLAAEVILKHLYMDDIAGAADTIELARQMAEQIAPLLARASFKAQKGNTNVPSILSGLNPDDVAGDEIAAVLGLKWNTKEDYFFFNLDDKFQPKIIEAKEVTRRVFLSLTSQLFDVMGYVLPFSMKMRIILPHLFQNGITWDENLEGRTYKEDGVTKKDEMANRAVKTFRQWCRQIPLLKKVKIPRWIGGELKGIAIFCDASMEGIGVVAYSVCKDTNGTMISRKLFARSRLAPKTLRNKVRQGDEMSVARLELVGNVFAGEMGQYICKAIHISPGMLALFGDSLCNIQRIQKGPDSCQKWEAARVTKVLQNTSVDQWSFCPGQENPADLPSRGEDLDVLLGEKQALWDEGPKWLVLPKTEWPKQPVPKVEKGKLVMTDDMKHFLKLERDVMLMNAEVLLVQEEKKEAKRKSTPLIMEETCLDILLDRISDYNKVVRIIARTKAILQAAKKPEQSGASLKERMRNAAQKFLMPSDIWSAQLCLIRKAQKDELPGDWAACVKGQISDKNPLPKNTRLRHLTPFYDESNDILRHETPRAYSDQIPMNERCPIILPKSEISARKILTLHQDFRHLAKKDTAHMLRRNFWVLGRLEYIGKIIRMRCATPNCQKPKSFELKMGPLPVTRMDKPEPFNHVSVDYMGPLHIQHMCVDTIDFKTRVNAKRYAKYKSKDKEEREREKAQREAEIAEMVATCPHNVQEGVTKCWISVFTCLQSRAVHLELVPDCTAEGFLIAMRRFIGLRGKPKTMLSDNAMTFKGADTQLRNLVKGKKFRKRMETARFAGASYEPIQWFYSTDKAPWTNAAVERLIGSIKKTLIPSLGQMLLGYHEMDAMVTELSGIINSRPLGVDTTSGEIITPAMLIAGKNLIPLEAEPPKVGNVSAIQAWNRRLKLQADFWRRWRKDYLARYDVYKKWNDPKDPKLKVGDVVLVKDDNKIVAKNEWKIGKVEQTIKNDKGRITKAWIRVPSGHSELRSVRNLAMIEEHAVFKGKSKTEATTVSAQGAIPAVEVSSTAQLGERGDQVGNARPPVPNALEGTPRAEVGESGTRIVLESRKRKIVAPGRDHDAKRSNTLDADHQHTPANVPEASTSADQGSATAEQEARSSPADGGVSVATENARSDGDGRYNLRATARTSTSGQTVPLKRPRKGRSKRNSSKK